MNYAVIKKNDVANGPGVRVNLFVSGCRHHCPGCFNAETWSFAYGEPYTPVQTQEILEAMAPEYVSGFTFLGGEPLEPENRGEVLALARALKEAYPDKSIWCYTGFLFEDLLLWADMVPAPLHAADQTTTNHGQAFLATGPVEDSKDLAELLSLIDVLVDGRFMQPLRNLMLKFRGSENQRILDLPASIEQKEAVLLPNM